MNEKQLTENEKKAIEGYRDTTNKHLQEFDKMMSEEANMDKELRIVGADGKEFFITTAQLKNLSAQKSVNRKVLVKVKHIKSTDISSNHVILRYFDVKEGVWKSESKLGGEDKFVPEFYKDHYRFLLTQTNMVFYCLIEDLDEIVELLEQDKGKVKKIEDTRNQAIDKFINKVEKKADKKDDTNKKQVSSQEEVLKKVDKNDEKKDNITDDDLNEKSSGK